MSGASRYSTSSTQSRVMTADELRLVRLLLASADPPMPTPQGLDSMFVVALNDGGMGSIRFLSRGAQETSRRFAKRVAETEFADDDGVPVSAALNIDQFGELFELDIWKADFSPLGHLPR